MSKHDDRGLVAVVIASCDGPMVTMIGAHRKGKAALIDALKVLAAVYAVNDGTSHLSWPKAVFVQQRAGQWTSV
jgi:hypothetical protein